MFKLMAHQQRGVQIAQRRSHFYFAWDPGTGKTALSIAIIDAGKARGFAGATLVLAPKSILRAAWEADTRKFAPQLKTVVAWDASPINRRQLIATPNVDVFICTYETAKKHFDDFYNVGVRRLIVDEASKCKSYNSQITKLVQCFARRMDEVYMLSGTPAPNGPHEWVPQLQIIDPVTFGGSYWRTMYEFFSPVKRMIGTKERIIAWRPLPHRTEDFTSRLASRSWSLRKSDCLDLPPQVDVVRPVELDAGEMSAYLSMLEDFKVEMRDGSTLTAAAQAVLMKLRQITGGAIYSDGVGREIGRSKLDALADVLDELGERPVVIWAEFTSEINRIVALVASRGGSVAVIDGSTPLDARTNAITQFQAGGLQCLVCHPAAAGHGITLTRACYDIFYSHSFSFETYEQARNRIHRTGQTEKVTHYHLIAKGTIDERVWWALRHKRNGHDAVMAVLSQDEAA
jgi:SNF2 family DNA or RNA helicase